MTIKPFAIQGADLTLGGVNLQAGTTGVVIPGTTQATSYKVEEVQDTGNQTLTFLSPPIVIDYVTFNDYDNNGTSTGRAEYIVEELDNDGYIDNIEVTDQGSYTIQESGSNDGNDLYAYTGSAQDPFATFVPADWDQIPFRPKMRAGEIENVGGGGGGSTLTNGDWEASLNSSGVLRVTNTDTEQNYFKLTSIQNENNTYGVMIDVDNQAGWTFLDNGSIQFPDGSVQATAYTGQTSGGGGGASDYIYIMANVDGNIVTSTDGVTWGDPTASGMTGINRVAVNNGTIVYAPGTEGPPGEIGSQGLYYSTTIGTVELCTGTNVLQGAGNLYWNQVRYFSEPDKWVAVGYADASPDEVPAVAYSDNGVDWTVVMADMTFVTGFNDGNDWQLKDIAWVTETQKYTIASVLNGQGLYGGIFVTDDLTTPLDSSVHVAIELNAKKVAPLSVVQFGGPPGFVTLIDNDSDNVVWSGYGTTIGNYDSDNQYWAESIANELGYVPGISEIAYNNTTWIGVTGDGQVFTPYAGPGVIVSVPLPYTTTDFSITNANPAVLTYSGTGPWMELKNNEKIVITGSGQYNGTYYYKSSNDRLYTDQAMTAALDASGFSTFASGGTLTMSHGQYFDAAGTGGGYFYIGNDDEQIFRSTNGTTWTQLADVDGQYFNDFAYGTFGGTTGVSFVQLADGSLQAQATGVAIASLSNALTDGKPSWLSITPRSPDRDTLDTHYGFDGDGMWFTGNNEETLVGQPAYPIHTTASFPADSQVVVEFDISLVSGEEDWGVCVYPADGVPHWEWDPHPSRIAAMVDCSVDGDPYAQALIHGLTSTNYGSNDTSDVARARFTYNPLAEVTILEIINADGQVTARVEQPGRLAKGQDYMIGFDADWDDAGPNDKSYFTNLSITVGDTSVTKATEFSLNGAVKLPSTVKGFINLQGPWINNTDNFEFHTVAAHNGFAYMGGENSWTGDDESTVRLDKYSLTTGELVWSRTIGAGRMAAFDISWTGGVYTITNIANGGVGYQVGQTLSISGNAFGGDWVTNRATITVTSVSNNGDGGIDAATITGTAPSGTSSVSGVEEEVPNAEGMPVSIKYDTTNDQLVMLNQQYSGVGDVEDGSWERAAILRINPVSGDIDSSVTLTDEGDIYAYDVAVHPTTGNTAVVGEKLNEFRSFGTLTMLRKGDGYFDILKSNLDEEYWPGNIVVEPQLYNGDFWIQGTGIATRNSVSAVNEYEALSCTTRQGTGAEFAISDDGFGNYTLVGVNAGGTNYLPGHKIKILGTSLGGATPDNDAIITVTTVSSGAITAGTISGTPGTTGLWTNVSGTNYNVGSGLTVDINVDPVTGSRMAYVNQRGSNYANGDVAIITGTQFANGATPANDVEVTVVGVLNGNEVDSVVTSGTTPTNAIRILVGGVDFTAGGNGQVTAVSNWNGQGGWNQGSYTNLVTTGGTGTGLRVDVAAGGGGYINISAITISNTGTGYTTGDVITINNENNLPGTFTITANTPGAWTMKQNLGGEAFVWTADWDKAIGGPVGDKFQAVTYSKDGSSIYAVGDGQYDASYRQSLVVKYATSNGNIGFSKFLNSSNNASFATGVATIGTSDIAVSGYEDVGSGQYKMFVARLSSGGQVLWKKFFYNTYGNYNSLERNNNVDVDSNDNIYVTLQHKPDASNNQAQQYGFTVVKLDPLGNKLWSRCVSAMSNGSYLGIWNGNRWSSLDGDQLVVAGYTYATDDYYYSGLWASFPTDGFTYFGGEDDFVQQGAFRFSQGAIQTGELSQNPGGGFTPSVQPPTITAVNNLKKYATRTPNETFPQHLQKIVDTKEGGLVFGDGTRQTTAADRISQIRADNDYYLTINDSGKHIYFRNNSGTVYIPNEADLNLPVGFTFTIINRANGSNCYVRLDGGDAPRGTILGAGRDLSTYYWGIPDSGSGSMVTLIKLESGTFVNSDYSEAPVWMISGPSDIYDAD